MGYLLGSIHDLFFQMPCLSEIRELRRQVDEGHDMLGLHMQFGIMTRGWVGTPVNIDVVHQVSCT